MVVMPTYVFTFHPHPRAPFSLVVMSVLRVCVCVCLPVHVHVEVRSQSHQFFLSSLRYYFIRLFLRWALLLNPELTDRLSWLPPP